MFAPRPPIIFGWLVARAELRDGRVVDPIHPDQEFTWEKPDHLSSEHRDSRDRIYQWLLISDQDPVRIERYADWLKEQWHRNNAEPIEDLTIYYLIVSLIGEDPVRQQLRI